MLNRLATLAVLLAIAYLLLTRVGPWLQGQLPSEPAATDSNLGSDGSSCVDRAFDANEALAAAARGVARPPADRDTWTLAAWEIERDLQAAAVACACPSEACRTASQALEEMRALLANLDGMVLGSSAGYSNPARQQERIYELLNEAQSSLGR